MRTFYKTTYIYEVLSEEPIPDDMGIASILNQCAYGDYSGELLSSNREELTGPEMAKALKAQGSDPGFFRLDEEGNDPGEGT